MKIKNLLATAILLFPITLLAQSNTDAEIFKSNVVDKVKAYNIKIRQLSKALYEAKENGSKDTIIIKAERKDTVLKCFQVPQDYINLNPSSPYSCQALGMLGKGEVGSPVTVNDLERLFNSLTFELRNTDTGRAYAEQLDRWKKRDQRNEL